MLKPLAPCLAHFKCVVPLIIIMIITVIISSHNDPVKDKDYCTYFAYEEADSQSVSELMQSYSHSGKL